MNILLLIILLAGFGWITWKNFKLGLGIFVFLLPTYFIRFSFGPLPTTLLELCFIILAVLWFFKERGWQFRDRNLKTWLVPVILFLLTATVAIFISPDKTAALGIWKAYFIEPVFFFFIIISTLKTREDWLMIFRALCFSGLVIAVFAIIQKFTGFAIPEAWACERRVTSVFGFPNAVGLYLAPIIILSFSLLYDYIKSKAWLWSAFYAIVFLASIIAIIFSKTEAAWIAAGCGLFIFCLFKKELRILAIVVVVAAILIIGLTPEYREPAMEKLLLKDWSGHVRLTIWKESWELLKAKPIFGAGLSGYPLAMVPFHKAAYIEIFQYPHNFLLNFWTEIGILGLIAWLWLSAKTLRYGLQNWRKEFSLIVVGFITVILIHGLVDVPYLKNDLAMIYWLFLGLSFYIKK